MSHAANMSRPEMKNANPRRSACADAALRAEIERVRKMTVEERVKAALSMRERFSWVGPSPKRK